MKPVEQKVLVYLKRQADQGYAPSYTEIAKAVGLKSRSQVHGVVHALADMGLIGTPNGRARAITLPNAPVSPAILNAMSDEALRSTIAHASGILAHRRGEYAATAFAADLRTWTRGPMNRPCTPVSTALAEGGGG